MRKRLACLLLGIALVSLLFTGCGKKSTKEKETSSTTAEQSSSEEETGTSDTIDDATSESETTTEAPSTTVKQEETITKKGEVTTTKKQEATTSKQEVSTTSKKEETMTKNQLSSGISRGTTYKKSDRYEVIDYCPEEYGWKALDVWWEPTQFSIGPYHGYVDWSVYTWYDKKGIDYLDEIKGNAVEYMPTYPNYEESYELYYENDGVEGFCTTVDYEMVYSGYIDGEYFEYTSNIDYVKYGMTTLYYRDKNEEKLGFGTECRLIKNDEDMCVYLNEIMENRYTEIAYRYDTDVYTPAMFNQACLMQYGIDLTQLEYATVSDSYSIGDGYEACYEKYEKFPYNKCKEVYSVKELKEYICYCFENGIKDTSVYLIGEDLDWTSFVNNNIDEFYLKYKGKVSAKHLTHVGGGEIQSCMGSYGTVYKYQDRTFLSIQLTEADENYEYYQIFTSMQDAKEYIKNSLENKEANIRVFFRLEDYVEENITDMEKLNSIVFELLHSDDIDASGYISTISWLNSGIKVDYEYR